MLWAFKGPIKGIGAPTPNFDPYASSYNHIFIQNTSKLHFLYPARVFGYEYVEKNVEKILQHFLEEKKLIFLVLELQRQFLSLISALTTIFLVKMSQNCTFCIQLSVLDIIVWFFVKQSPQPFLKEKRTLFFDTEALLPNQRPMMAIINNFPTNWVEFGHIFIWITLKKLSWIQKGQFCGSLIKNAVIGADIRL